MLGARGKERINVRQAQVSPSLAGTPQVFEELADLVELLANRYLGVATMLLEMSSVVAQDRCGRHRAARDLLPWWNGYANYLVDPVQCAHRRTRKREICSGDSTRMRVPHLEALDRVVRQFVGLVEPERIAVASEPADPIQVLPSGARTDAGVSVPHTQDVPGGGRAFRLY